MWQCPLTSIKKKYFFTSTCYALLNRKSRRKWSYINSVCVHNYYYYCIVSYCINESWMIPWVDCNLSNKLNWARSSRYSLLQWKGTLESSSPFSNPCGSLCLGNNYMNNQANMDPPKNSPNKLVCLNKFVCIQSKNLKKCSSTFS